MTTDKDTNQTVQFELLNEHPDAQSVGEQYRMFGFLPGGYICMCQRCDNRFIGAKRSSSCLDCARILEKERATTDKDTNPFEGVRAEFKESHQKIGGTDVEGYDIIFLSGSHSIKPLWVMVPKDLANAIVSRWNAYEGNQRGIEQNKIDKLEIQGQLESLDRQNELLRKENHSHRAQSVDGALKMQVDTLNEEVSRLKEENERLKAVTNLCCNEDLQSQLSAAQREIESLKQIPSDEDIEYLLKLQEVVDNADKYIEIKAGYVQPFVNAVKELSKAQERIEELQALGRAAETVATKQIEKVQFSEELFQELQARIKELETPDIFHDYKTCEISPGYSMLWELMEDKKGVVEVVRSKDLGNKFCIWIPTPDNDDERGYVKEFNDLEEAQQAIEGDKDNA